jgi:DNA-binding transcriptional LysR family regulator
MPRRVVLTEAGERLIERAHLILREHDAALAELAELAGAEHGRLRVGSASGMVSADALPAILKMLRKGHAHAEVSVRSGTSEELVKKILAGELDLAFVSLPVQARNIETELLSQDQLVAIASPRHPLARQRVVSAFALAGERLILGERGGNTRRLIDEFFAEAGLKPTVTMELSRQAAIKNMVAAGMGVGIVPLSTARDDVERGRLVRWWIEGARINWELGVARLSGGYLSPVCQSFIGLCHDYFSAEARSVEGKSPRARKSMPRVKKPPVGKSRKGKPKK